MKNFMKNSLIMFGFVLVLVAISAVISEFVPEIDLFPYISSLIIILTISASVFFVIGICQKIKEINSPYKAFAIVDGFIGLIVLIYAIYDIKTGTEKFSGLIGWMLLLYVIPLMGILLMVDFIIWNKARKKLSKEIESVKTNQNIDM